MAKINNVKSSYFITLKFWVGKIVMLSSAFLIYISQDYESGEGHSPIKIPSACSDWVRGNGEFSQAERMGDRLIDIDEPLQGSGIDGISH